jgi:hypothetical protein
MNGPTTKLCEAVTWNKQWTLPTILSFQSTPQTPPNEATGILTHPKMGPRARRGKLAQEPHTFAEQSSQLTALSAKKSRSQKTHTHPPPNPHTPAQTPGDDKNSRGTNQEFLSQRPSSSRIKFRECFLSDPSTKTLVYELDQSNSQN